MAQTDLNYGTTAGDGTGDNLFDIFGDVQTNFTELYSFAPSAALLLDGTTTMVGAIDTSVGTLTSSVAASGTAKYFTLTSDNATGSGDKLLSVMDDTDERLFVGDTGGVKHAHLNVPLTIRDYAAKDQTLIGAEAQILATTSGQLFSCVDLAIEADANSQFSPPQVTAFKGIVASYGNAPFIQGGSLTGLDFEVRHASVDWDVGPMTGIKVNMISNPGTAFTGPNPVYALDVRATFNGGVPPESTGVYVRNLGKTGITDTYGLLIARQNGSTNNHGIFLNGDDSGSDIIFGTGKDSRIYEHGSYFVIDPDLQGVTGRYVRIEDGLSVNGWAHVVGDFTHAGTNLGFYGATKVAQATAMTGADATATDGTIATNDTITNNLRIRVNELEAMLDATTGIGVAA